MSASDPDGCAGNPFAGFSAGLPEGVNAAQRGRGIVAGPGSALLKRSPTPRRNRRQEVPMPRPFALALLAASGVALLAAAPQSSSPADDLDARVSRFLEERRGTWRDMNVPDADGRALREIVLTHRYTRALEIGTSTGHSGIWIAWALAKTGGKLVTIDIDEGRHQEAVANFKAAGLAAFIDARLADAHELVPQLSGPLDFVFIDADKDWYTNYAKAVLPRLRVGGCLTAHNVYGRRWWRSETGEYYDYVTSLPFLETTIVNGGLSISYKRQTS
jgi:predicted O-methyltransferase YrrM